jgi:adenine phosphoribosyltransferase
MVSEAEMEALKQRIRHVPDFPKPGILFYDVTTLLDDRAGFKMALDAMAAPHADSKVDLVVGIESRGFIFGAAIADRLGAGFAPVRKPGKLPSKTRRQTYALEYGTDALEIHEDAVEPSQRVLIVDDLLATGGTASAAVGLVRGLGGQVMGLQFLIELVGLNGRERLKGEQIGVVLKY